MADILTGDAIASLFFDVAALLKRYEAYWRLHPMGIKTLPWQPALNAQLTSLTLAELSALDQSPQLQAACFRHFFPALFELPLFWHADNAATPVTWPFWLSNGIAGRKLEQIQQFCQFLPASDLPILEWCAGKGHLGRLLAAAGTPSVTSIEWQPALCQDGEQLAQRFGLQQRFVQADVLSPAGQAVLTPAQQVVALHACGELHLALLRSASQIGCQQLHLSPCCYHLISHDTYVPLSRIAQASDLALTRQELKLAVQGQVTAGERIARLREIEVSWRLAYDALRAHISGESAYQPLPSLPKHWFSGAFTDFIQFAAAQQHLVLPTDIDFESYHQQGQQAYLRLQQLDAVRHLFRRPLELYLVLDRALFLQQQGYEVSVRAFCDYELTPRNLCLHATLAANASITAC